MKKMLILGAKIFGIFIICIFILGALGTCINHTSNTSVVDIDTCLVEQVDTISEPEIKTWEYTEEKDEMTDSKNFWYSLKSDNFVNFDFPYEGDSYLNINIRYMRKDGYNVILTIDKGQMVGNEINNTNYVTVRFDNDKPEKYYYDSAADYSSDTVFIRNKSKFIKKCKKAKNIIIEQEFYHEGCKTFKFHVDKSLVIK